MPVPLLLQELDFSGQRAEIQVSPTALKSIFDLQLQPRTMLLRKLHSIATSAQKTVSESLKMRAKSGDCGNLDTGKTSIIMQRMLHLESQGTPRQLFITANEKLKTKTETIFHGMLTMAGMADRGSKGKVLPPALDMLNQSDFPLFLTLNDFLTMLDGTLHIPFFPRKQDGSLIENNTTSEMFDTSEKDSTKKVPINFFRFLKLWSKMKDRSTLSTKMSPSVAYQEIITFIKGSSFVPGYEEEFGNAASRAGPRSRDQYLKIPAKMSPSFAKSAEGRRF